jgi:hypothetical protein
MVNLFPPLSFFFPFYLLGPIWRCSRGSAPCKNQLSAAKGFSSVWESLPPLRPTCNASGERKKPAPHRSVHLPCAAARSRLRATSPRLRRAASRPSSISVVPSSAAIVSSFAADAPYAIARLVPFSLVPPPSPHPSLTPPPPLLHTLF